MALAEGTDKILVLLKQHLEMGLSGVDRQVKNKQWPSDSPGFINLLKPTGHVMHQQFNIQQLYALPHCIYVFCVYLRTNSDMCQLQHKLTGFYNWDEKCLLRGTNWVFK